MQTTCACLMLKRQAKVKPLAIELHPIEPALEVHYEVRSGGRCKVWARLRVPTSVLWGPCLRAPWCPACYKHHSK